MVAVLLSHPEVEVNTAGEDEMTPLILAARAGNNAVAPWTTWASGASPP